MERQGFAVAPQLALSVPSLVTRSAVLAEALPARKSPANITIIRGSMGVSICHHLRPDVFILSVGLSELYARGARNTSSSYCAPRLMILHSAAAPKGARAHSNAPFEYF